MGLATMFQKPIYVGSPTLTLPRVTFALLLRPILRPILVQKLTDSENLWFFTLIFQIFNFFQKFLLDRQMKVTVIE